MEIKRQVGIIKWYDKSKGFGVIITGNDGEYFVHDSEILNKNEEIFITKPFIFEKSVQKGKKSAKNCTTPVTKDDFLLSLQLIGQHRIVQIEYQIKEENKWGKQYIKKTFKNCDILRVYLLELVNKNKLTLEVIKDYFESGYDSIRANNDILKIIDYYKITKSLIKPTFLADMSKLFGVIEKTNKDEIGKKLNELFNQNNTTSLLHKLLSYYNSLLTDIQNIKIWQAGEYYTYSDVNLTAYFNNHSLKIPISFNENLFIEYYNELNFEDMKRIGGIEIKEITQNKIIEKALIEKFVNFEDLKKTIETVNVFNLATKYFDLIINRIDDDLYYKIWYSKTVFINYNLKEINFNFPYSSDFEIPFEILLKKSEEISYSVIYRISRCYNNKNEIISKILKQKVHKKSISSENLLQFIESIKILDIEYQIDILEIFLLNINEDSWIILIENKRLLILPNSIGLLLSLNFSISDIRAKFFADLILKSELLDFEKKINYLNNLSSNFLLLFTEEKINEITDKQKLLIITIFYTIDLFNLVSLNWKFDVVHDTIDFLKFIKSSNLQFSENFLLNLKSTLNALDVRELLDIYTYIPENYIVESIIDKFDFKLEYNLITVLTSIFNSILLSDAQKTKLSSNFYIQTAELSIDTIINVLNLFVENNIIYKIENIDFFKDNSMANKELLKIIYFNNNIHGSDYSYLEQRIQAYINDNILDNSIILLEILRKSNSIVIISSVILKFKLIKNAEIYLDIIKTNPFISKVDSELIYNSLENYLNDFPILVLEIALLNFNQFYDLFAQKIILKSQVIIDFYKLLINIEYKKKIKKLIATENDINTLALFHISFSKRTNIVKLNKLFEKYNYDFQSLILKFYINQFKCELIEENQLISIVNSIECKELSALMIKSFINQKVNSRSELMNLMNQVLKSHFKFLSDDKLNETTFKNIFSLKYLVKNCDGRKRYSGNTLIVGTNENILCEGRFWKHNGSYDLYWCKGRACAGVNNTVNFRLKFEEWTLSEIGDLFKMSLDRLAFVHLAGWLNRMETIFDRLKCQECNNYLRPKVYTPHALGHYAVPLFICVNEDCDCYNKEIRFTHCRGCHKILDSRACVVCKQCKWLICDDKNCGKCGCGADYSPVYAEY